MIQPPVWNEGLQSILNAHDVPPRDAQTDYHEPMPVRVRIVWKEDGEEFVDTFATAYWQYGVLVDLRDKRSRTKGVWVGHGDVMQRTRR